MRYTSKNTTAIIQVWILRFFVLIMPMSSFSQKKLFIAYEDSLMRIAPTILQGKNDVERQLANEKFLALWEPILDESRSMKYPFDSLKQGQRLSIRHFLAQSKSRILDRCDRQFLQLDQQLI